MHDYLNKSFSLSGIPKRVGNAKVYNGKRNQNQQEVLIYKVSFVNSCSLEKFVNEFTERMLISNTTEIKVTDCHLDLSKNHIVFAVTPSNTDFVEDLIECQNLMNGESPLIKHPKTNIDYSIKIPAKRGDETPGVEVLEQSAVYRKKILSTKSTSVVEDSLKNVADSISYIGNPTRAVNSVQSEVYYLAEGETQGTPKSYESVPMEEKQVKDNQFQEIIALLDEDLSNWTVEKESGHYSGRLIVKGINKAKDLRVCTKNNEGSSTVVVRTEATISDIDLDVLAGMYIDLEIRRQWDTTFIKLERAHVISEHEDIIYQKMKLPFPLSSRDFVLQRFYADNFQDPDKITEKGFWKKSNRYKVITLKSVDYESYPEKKGTVRASNSTIMIFEEDPQGSGNIIYRIVSLVDLNGNLPAWALHQGTSKGMVKLVEETIQAYRRHSDEWKKKLSSNSF